MALLTRAQAHPMPERVFADLDPRLRHERPDGAEHSVWELLEHLRLAQEDILQYVLDPAWDSPRFPEGYWPDPAQPPDEAAWAGSLAGFQKDLQALVALARDERIDLTAKLPHAPQHTYLRELLIAADHNAYHAGQVVDVRRALGAWPPRPTRR